MDGIILYTDVGYFIHTFEGTINLTHMFPELEHIYPQSVYTSRRACIKHSRSKYCGCDDNKIIYAHVIFDTYDNIHMIIYNNQKKNAYVFFKYVCKSYLENQHIIDVVVNTELAVVNIKLGNHNVVTQKYHVEEINTCYNKLICNKDDDNVHYYMKCKCGYSTQTHDNIAAIDRNKQNIVLKTVCGNVHWLNNWPKYGIIRDSDWFNPIFDNKITCINLCVYYLDNNALFQMLHSYDKPKEISKINCEIYDTVVRIHESFVVASNNTLVFTSCFGETEEYTINCNKIYYIQNKARKFGWSRDTHKMMKPSSKNIVKTIIICNSKMGIYKIPYCLLSNIITNILFG